jgi:predicted acylesterase/phospholipase RssA
MNSVQNQGLFSPTIVKDLFAPLLNGKNISLDITLLDFYDLTKKDFHFITTEYHRFLVEDISYKTHPEWKLLDAIYASCCLPFVFAPLYKDNKIYLDGGIIMHYPLNLSIAAGNDPKEIMGIRRASSITKDELALTRENSLFEVLYNIILKLIDKEKEPIYSDELGYKIEVQKDFYNIYTYLYKCIHSDEARKELIEVGVQSVYP